MVGVEYKVNRYSCVIGFFSLFIYDRHADTASKSEAKAHHLLMELGTLKRFAERTELMNPQLSLILVGLLCRLVDEISKDPQRTGKAMYSSTLDIVDPGAASESNVLPVSSSNKPCCVMQRTS